MKLQTRIVIVQLALLLPFFIACGLYRYLQTPIVIVVYAAWGAIFVIAGFTWMICDISRDPSIGNMSFEARERRRSPRNRRHKWTRDCEA